MDQETAYCCLNCSNSPSCCGACGECPACCEGCGDPNECRTTAYFNGSNFYKDFIFTATSSTSYNIRNVDTNCIGGIIQLQQGIVDQYSTLKKPGEECSRTGMSLGDVNFCFEGYKVKGSYNGLTYYLEYLCDGSYQMLYGGDDCSGGIFESGPAPCPYTEKVDDCETFGEKECIGPECYPACNPTPCEAGSTFRSSRSAKITFVNQLNLYNQEGEDVGNIIGATYNPCNASRVWFAPGCHFFHE